MSPVREHEQAMGQRMTAENGVIAALIAGVLIYGLAMGTTYPLLGIVLSGDVTPVWNGFNAAATGLGLIAGVMMVPAFSRRFGAGRTCLSGVIVMTVSLAMLAAVRDFWVLFAARMLLGCGANMLFVVAETALNALVMPARRGRVMGLYAAATAFGFVVGPAIVAATPDTPAMLLLGCAAVTACALLPLRHARRPVDRLVRPTSVNRIWPAVTAFPFAFGFLFMASAIDAVAISLLPLVALDQSHPVEAGALFVTIFHVGLLCGQPVIGAALDRFGRRFAVLGCCLVSLACTAALVFGDRLDFVPAAVLMFAWGGANYGLYTAGLALIGDRFSGEALTAATAAFAAVYATAAIAAPILAGGALDGIGAAGFYVVTAGVYLIAFLGGAVFFRPLEPTLVPR
jgi:MFS family permease